ncbi:hypothetical protein [Bacillus kexueae]|uniref:hypothetical protein n=1 Tax=Aeribacillus kexueae TaxID=2078952 RepID=UPI001FAEEDF7|nr:hypothetical protein [Bacillus kexueae]
MKFAYRNLVLFVVVFIIHLIFDYFRYHSYHWIENLIQAFLFIVAYTFFTWLISGKNE